MENVLLVVHLILALGMILLILIQRNAQDGGGLLGGGSGTMGGMFTARGSANVLSRTTAILATAFIITSLLLTIMANNRSQQSRDIAGQIPPLPQSAPQQAGGDNAVPVVPKVELSPAQPSSVTAIAPAPLAVPNAPVTPKAPSAPQMEPVPLAPLTK